jgi:signal transduction histidine kinase
MRFRHDTGDMIGRGVPRGAIACGVLVIVAKVTLSLPRLPAQPALVAITWAVVCSFVAVGLVLFRTSVPSVNAWGCLLAAAATIPGDLAEPAYAGVGLTTVGYTFEQVYLPATVALALRFPDRRLTWSRRLLVWGLWASAIGLRAVVILTSGPLPSGFHAPPGWRTLPASAFAHDGAMRLSLVATALVLAAAAGVLAAEVLRNRGVRRESRMPIAVIGSIAALAAAVEQTVRLSATTSPYSWAPAMVRDLAATAIPVALLGYLLRRRAAGATIAARVVAAAQRGDTAQLQQALRDALSDPTLVVDTHPQPGYAPTRPGRRLREVLGDEGTLLCVLDVDERSSDDELLEAAVGAVRLGIENARLHDELLTHMEEVRQSRARIVEASAAERRRVERDLHDGVQQQLLAIAALLSRAGLASDGDSMRPKVDRARRQLQDALAELRRLAHGIHPAALSQGGLTTALPELALMSPVPVHVHLDEQLRERRLPQSVESTVYFVVAEALANVSKHADAASAGVRVEIVDDAALALTVQDDGVGGAVATKGGGIAGLADRVHALGGLLTVGPAAGGGTVLSASIPLSGPVAAPGSLSGVAEG